MHKRIEAAERRAAFAGNPRKVLANAGGLYSPPVPLIAPDASGWYSITSASFVDVAAFVASPYGQFWALIAVNGAYGDWSFQVNYPSGSRVLGTSAYLETHPTLGPIHKVACALDDTLQAATTVYGTTVTLQGKTANSTNSNKARLIAAGWGSPNV